MLTTTDGISLNVEVSGDGPPVLLLHGFPDSLRMWDDMTPYLVNAGYKTIAFDQRGFGLSSAPPEVSQYRIDAIVEDVVAVLKNEGIHEKIRLVGHDWGALIGWKLAIDYPQLVHSYTAISVGHPTSYKNAGLEQKLKGWYVLVFQLRGLAELMLKANNFARFRRLSTNKEEVQRWISDLSRPGRLTAALNWYRANFAELFTVPMATCRVPVMGVYSTRDIALTEEQMTNSENYVKSIWRYERIEDCGHWIPTEQPKLLASLLIDWFKD